MTYKIFQISKPDKSLFRVELIDFNAVESMIDYCFEMDNDSYFYYGAALD